MTTEISSAGRIVVGTDGSPRANRAVEWAADRAAARGLPLLIVLSIPELPIPGRTAAAAAVQQGVDYLQEYEDEAQRHIDAVSATVRQKHPGLDIGGVLVHGNPADMLIKATEDAEQVVVGARGRRAPLSVRLLGGVSDAVVSHAKGPVAVVSDLAEENPTGPVVVGIDDSVPAREAARLAFEAAEVRGVKLIVVNAWDFGPYDAFNAEIWDRSMKEITEGLTEMVQDLVAPEKQAHPNVEVEVRVVRGRPEQAIIEASKGAGLVVVGSRGRGGFTGLLLGSTSKHVLREAHAPVVVTRG